jgi:hypothetical protein
MILPIFFACSCSMPSLRAASMRYSLPLAKGSPTSRCLRLMLRLMNFDSRTSSTALTRSSVEALSRSFSPLQSTEAPTFLKS